MKFFGLLLLIAFCSVFATGSLRGDGGKYELSENQRLRLEVKQARAQLAQQQLVDAQGRFNSAVVDFTTETKAIEKENSWPETLIVDPNTLTFTEAPKPPDPPAKKKPAEPIPPDHPVAPAPK